MAAQIERYVNRVYRPHRFWIPGPRLSPKLMDFSVTYVRGSHPRWSRLYFASTFGNEGALQVAPASHVRFRHDFKVDAGDPTSLKGVRRASGLDAFSCVIIVSFPRNAARAALSAATSR